MWASVDSEMDSKAITGLSGTVGVDRPWGQAYFDYALSSHVLRWHSIVDARGANHANFASSAALFGLVDYRVHSTTGADVYYRGFDFNGNAVSGIMPRFNLQINPSVKSSWENNWQRIERKSVVVLSDGPLFPGEEPNNPLIASTFITDDMDRHPIDDTDDGADLAEDIAATNLTSLPVMGTYGYDDPVYVQFPEPSLPIGPTSPLFYYSQNAFTSLTIPSLSEGRSAAADYAISVQGQTYTITGGTTVDLAALGVTDVNVIRLWPLNEGDPIPQVLGLTFASEGVTDLWQGIIVPEPSTLALAICGGIALLAVGRERQWRRGPPSRNGT